MTIIILKSQQEGPVLIFSISPTAPDDESLPGSWRRRRTLDHNLATLQTIPATVDHHRIQASIDDTPVCIVSNSVHR